VAARCTEVPELTLLRGDYSLLSYLEGPVSNYFLAKPSTNAASRGRLGRRRTIGPGPSMLTASSSGYLAKEQLTVRGGPRLAATLIRSRFLFVPGPV
jgi:hypothetical protein